MDRIQKAKQKVQIELRKEEQLKTDLFKEKELNKHNEK